MIYKAKKSLGQNFLKSEIALRKITETGEIKPDDVILEIGPGKGALTEKLLQAGAKVIAIEKDRELFEILQQKFSEQIKFGSLVLVHDDILDFDANVYGLKPSTYKIIANIPYNITGAILKKFLTEKNQPERMVLLVQHEVAKRIVGRGSNPSTSLRVKESILSISVKAYGEPKIIMKVAARYFSPAPKVDSAIISIKNISRKLFNSPLEEYPVGGGGNSVHPGASATPQEGNLETRFWEIVKAGFAHKRKKLSGNLKSLKNYTDYEKNIKEANLGNKRAEELTLEDWIFLARA